MVTKKRLFTECQDFQTDEKGVSVEGISTCEDQNSPQAHPCTRMPGFNVSSAARESHILFLVQSSSKEAYCIVHLVCESSELWQRRGLWSAEAMVFSVTIYRPRSFISTNIPYPRFANLQSRRRSRLARNLHLPLRRTHLVLRHFLSQPPAMVNLRAMGKGRHSQAGYLQVLTQRCRRGCAFDGDTSRGRLQGRAYREGIDMGRFVTCVYCCKGRESESAGAEGGRGAEGAGEGWAVDV